MQPSRHVRIFKNGRNRAIRIPKDFELPGDEVILRKEGVRLIIEPVSLSLLSILATLETLEEDFPDVDEGLLPPDTIEVW